MNLMHRRYCRSRRWRHHLDALLPWATADVPLAGADVLELGSGPGQTTDWLRSRVRTLTAVEYDKADAEALSAGRTDVTVLHADATDLPLPERSFDVVVCFTMLHHIPSVGGQDRLFAEAARVLRPGGVFAGSDSRWGPLFAVAHLGDTMTLVPPDTLADRLTAAGFSNVRTKAVRHAVRFSGTAR
jgi:SAM-dependent methyltransferase